MSNDTIEKRLIQESFEVSAEEKIRANLTTRMNMHFEATIRMGKGGGMAHETMQGIIDKTVKAVMNVTAPILENGTDREKTLIMESIDKEFLRTLKIEADPKLREQLIQETVNKRMASEADNGLGAPIPKAGPIVVPKQLNR